MATSTDSDTALLTEHFGYPPVSLLDDIINSINILAERALNSVEQGLLAQTPASLGFKAAPPPPPTGDDDSTSQTAENAARHEIENGTHQLETLLCASIDRNFDKFELYAMQNILCVRRDEPRDWIRLGHYEGLDLDAAAAGGADGGATEDEVRRLHRRLQASQKLNGMLHAERARNAALLGELRAIVGGPKAEAQQDGATAPSLAFLRDQGALTDGDADTPLTTTVAFSLSQMQALRALSTSLRNVLPDLAEAPSDPNLAPGRSAPKSWRQERLEYVETATKRHLENVRGLELGSGGEVQDGEWQGDGRGLGKGEIESLERVVTLLGPGKTAEGSKGDGDVDER